MDFQKARPAASGRAAAMPIPREHLSPHPRRDRRRVALARGALGRVAGDPLAVGAAQRPAADLHLAAIRALVDVDLERDGCDDRDPNRNPDGIGSRRMDRDGISGRDFGRHRVRGQDDGRDRLRD
jgi:hypothetical protein